MLKFSTMRVITFDIETSNTFDEVGSASAADLDLAVICIHDSETGEITSYLQEDLNKLWPIMEKADALVGWNSDHFDIPLLNKYYEGDLTKIKSIDLMNELKKSCGRRIKLDYVAQATLGEAKSADGLQSIIWWRQGKIDEVIEYCKQDVNVTRKIYDYAMKNKSLKFIKDGQTSEFEIDTSDWDKIEDAEPIPQTLF
jgi:DEAD/DEAH box helicase domain-containing protein